MPFKEEMVQQGNDVNMVLDMMSAQLQEKDAALMKLVDQLNDKELENENLQKRLDNCLKTEQEKYAALMKLGETLERLQKQVKIQLDIKSAQLKNERLQKQLAECLKTNENLTIRYENEIICLIRSTD